MVFKEDVFAAYKGQQNLLEKENGFVERDYLKTLNPSSSHIEVIAGIRRCGKSTLMRQIANRFYNKVAYFNFEDSRVFGFEVSDFSKLDEVIGHEVEAYFFDEIQNVSGWEVFVRQLHERGAKVFVTGSNASLLSRELGTRLTGRYLSHEVFPFSYREYLLYFSIQDTLENFKKYVQCGGFPEFLRDQNPEILQMLLKDILFRDIAVRYGIKNTHVLMDIALYLVSNIGKEVSFNGLRNNFNVGSPTTVSDYLSWMEDAYLLFYLPRFSWSAKSISKNPKKVYCIDTGFAKSNSLSFSKDEGRLLENLVYLNLRKKFPKLFYFRERQECDFVVFEGNSCKWLIQVCDTLHPDNRDREINGLMEAMEFLKMDIGYILTLNQNDQMVINEKTIIIQEVRMFLTWI
jgi:predicted AAA+ superfamily ATPase